MGVNFTPEQLAGIQAASGQPIKPAGAVPTAEEIAAQKAQAAFQEQQLKEAQAKASRFEAELKAGPQLTYNPIEETVGPDGKKTIGLRKELQMTGPEAYVQSERERLKSQQALGLSDLQGQIAQQQAQQQGRLAQYGIKGGNRALMGRYSMRDALMARQGLGRQFQTQAGELEAKGMQLGRETQQANIAGLGKAISGVEQFNLDKWKKQKEVEAAKYQAEASRPQDTGGSSFICTKLRSKGLMSKKESLIMTKFMIGSLFKRASFLVWYFTKGKHFVEKAEAQGFDWASIKKEFVDDIIALIKNGEIEKAQEQYIKSTGNFCIKFGDTSYSSEYEKTSFVSSLNFFKLFFIKECQIWMKSNYLKLGVILSK